MKCNYINFVFVSVFIGNTIIPKLARNFANSNFPLCYTSGIILSICVRHIAAARGERLRGARTVRAMDSDYQMPCHGLFAKLTTTR